MKYICLLIFIVISNASYGQVFLSGKVKANNGLPLASASVQISRDTLPKKLVLSGKDGTFTYQGSAPGLYRLVISYTGFLTKDTTVFIRDSLSLQLTLFQQSVLLDSVSIRSKKNLVEKKVDRIVYNVDGVSLYENKSVGDILKSIPRLTVTRNSIEIKGSGTAAVMINDRIIYLSNRDLLEYLSIFKDDISSIELITNPPAKYDAQGAGLINIVTKKKKTYGLFGYIESGLTKNTYLENDETLNIGFRNKNFSLIASGGGSFGAYQETTDASSTFFSPGHTNWTDDAKNKNSFNNKRFNIVSEWLLDKNTRLYSSYSFADSHNNTLQNHILNYTSNGALDSIGITNGSNTNQGVTNIVNLGLNRVFGKNNNTLDASIDYVDKTSTLLTTTRTKNYLSDRLTPSGNIYDLLSSGNIPKDVASGKLDFFFPKLFSLVNLETGAKYTRFNNNSQTDYNEFINDVSIYNGIATKDTFHYREQNIAGYVSLNRDFKKWSAKAGLRYEETITKGFSSTEEQQHTLGYLFPSAFVQYKFTDMTSADLSYTRRIVRPTLFDINPFKFFTSINSDYVGNPSLSPSLQDHFNFNFVLKSNYLFSVFYNITYSPIFSFPFNTGQNIIETRKENDGKLSDYGFNFDASFNLRTWWQSNFSAAVSSYTYATDFNYHLGKTPVNITLSTRHSFQVSPSLSTDFSFSATLPGGGYNISTQKGYSSLDIGFTKSMLSKKLILTVAAQDILRSESQQSTVTTGDFRSANGNYYDFRQLAVSLKYKFGKELKVVRKKSTIQEANRLR